jgi:hypothetical protein
MSENTEYMTKEEMEKPLELPRTRQVPDTRIVGHAKCLTPKKPSVADKSATLAVV